MKTITDDEYQEYTKLKLWHEKRKIRESAHSVTRLEDDIDAPIKKCVAMLALLGCAPIYSCCGFDYNGQPFHKSHQYGRPYFILTANQNTFALLETLSRSRTGWQGGRGNHPTWTNLELMVGMNPHWRREECIHFSEECVGAIALLENVLVQFFPKMVETITLIDSNSLAKKVTKHWQYPPKEPWTINKWLLNGY